MTTISREVDKPEESGSIDTYRLTFRPLDYPAEYLGAAVQIQV